MPRRNVNITVVLGDGPSSTPVAGSWDMGIAVASDGTNDEWGMLIGRAASEDDDIIGWTIRPQKSGDIATLRTMLDGTIMAKLGPMLGSDLTIGNALWLMIDGSGRLTDDSDLISNARYCALALEHNKVEGDYCEVYVMSQKYVTDV